MRPLIRYTFKIVSYAKELTSVYICYSQGNGFNTIFYTLYTKVSSVLVPYVVRCVVGMVCHVPLGKRRNSEEDDGGAELGIPRGHRVRSVTARRTAGATRPVIGATRITHTSESAPRRALSTGGEAILWWIRSSSLNVSKDQ